MPVNYTTVPGVYDDSIRDRLVASSTITAAWCFHFDLVSAASVWFGQQQAQNTESFYYTAYELFMLSNDEKDVRK